MLRPGRLLHRRVLRVAARPVAVGLDRGNRLLDRCPADTDRDGRHSQALAIGGVFDRRHTPEPGQRRPGSAMRPSQRGTSRGRAARRRDLFDRDNGVDRVGTPDVERLEVSGQFLRKRRRPIDGVGMGRGVFLKAGDVMIASVERIGSLTNPVVEAAGH